MERKTIKFGDRVEIKSGHSIGQIGEVTLLATVNGRTRYFVKRPNGTIAWYNYHSVKRVKPC